MFLVAFTLFFRKSSVSGPPMVSLSFFPHTRYAWFLIFFIISKDLEWERRMYLLPWNRSLPFQIKMANKETKHQSPSILPPHLYKTHPSPSIFEREWACCSTQRLYWRVEGNQGKYCEALLSSYMSRALREHGKSSSHHRRGWWNPDSLCAKASRRSKRIKCILFYFLKS